ncbi:MULTISPECIES: type II secretion system protein [Caloramator]|uniref:Uncharacterized protein n=1 Tax=Caloramator australicus RC3 TaxID=857293 RepID=I7KA05_9CLOT|nr:MULTISPECIES: type II secretion system protein [Caloramator]MDO6355936.1 type II secretion system protein [Caloramator sp. CAR-1]CCJ34512.1 hypothetical protein CAAU_2429 [Caloramator australicus RC3]
MKKKGFTLLEMIIVISIIALLVGITTPQISKAMKKSKAMADVVTANTIAATIQEVVLEGGEIKDTGGIWVKISQTGVFTDNTIDLSKYLEGFDKLKPKMNSSYVFCYKYNAAENKLEIGAGRKDADNNIIQTEAYNLYPSLNPAYK